MATKIAVMNAGVIQQFGTPDEIYERPANLFVAGFIGSPAMNLVEVPIADGGVKFGNSVVPVDRDALSATTDKTVTVGVRPEHFDVAGPDSDQGLAVTVNVVEELGADAYVYGTAKVGGDDSKDLVVRVSGRDVPEKGSTLHIVPRSGETHVFSTSTGERLSD